MATACRTWPRAALPLAFVGVLANLDATVSNVVIAANP